jgi:hypothetical protein
MPKSRQRKKRRLAAKSGLRVQRLPTLTPEGHQELQKAVIAFGKQRAAAFPEAVAKVDALLREVYPLQLLAVVSNYGLQGFITEKGIHKPKVSKREFSQHHVELFQALALRIPEGEWGGSILTSANFEPAVEALIDAAEAFGQQRYLLLENADTPAKQMLLQMQERLRLHTQVVRNWGSFQQVVGISKRLYVGLDVKLKAKIGLSASALVDLFEKLVDRVQQKSSARMAMLARVFDKKLDRDGMIRKYYELNQQFTGSADELIAGLPEGTTRDNVMAMVFSHSDLTLESFYTFTAAEAATLISAEEGAVVQALDQLTQKRGQLGERPAEYLFLDNPVWSRPLLPAPGGGYFTATPQAFFSHIHRIFAKLCQAAGLEVALAGRRAAFLEEELHQLVSCAFPSARVISGVKWRAGEIEGETDTIVLIDRTLLIFEAKSGAISGPALRGAPDRAKRHVRELIEEPSLQSARFQALVEAAQQGDAGAQDALRPHSLWPIDVARIVRTTITLEDFSILSCAEVDLGKVGWIDPQHKLAPAMTIADLEVLGDIIGEEAMLVHYLQERMRLQKRFDVMGDELDWLGLYLQTGYAFAATEKSELDGMMITGLSEIVDKYYNARDEGVAISKPRLELTPLWRAMLDEIARRRFPGWIDASVAVLRAASLDEQKQVERAFRKLLQRAPKDRGKPGKNTAVFIQPVYDDPTIVILFAYPSLDRAAKRKDAELLAQSAFQKSSAQRVLAIGFDVDRPRDQVDYLAIIGRDAVASGERGDHEDGNSDDEK